MITSVIGRLMPNVPPIINANAESKFPSGCAARSDIARYSIELPREEAERLWLRKG
jgi:hypothetical protein